MLEVQFDLMIGYIAILYARGERIKNGENCISDFDFGIAIRFLERGYVLQRKTWAKKHLIVYKTMPKFMNKKIAPTMFSLPNDLRKAIANDIVPFRDSYKCMIYNTITRESTVWEPTLADMFAQDWCLPYLKPKYNQ